MWVDTLKMQFHWDILHVKWFCVCVSFSLLCLHNDSIALTNHLKRTYIEERKVDHRGIQPKGFPLLFSALLASPFPAQSTTNTLASYCSTMYNTSAWLWRAFLRRNDVTEEIASGKQHQRAATALGFWGLRPRLKLRPKHASNSWDDCGSDAMMQLRTLWE